MESQRRGVTWWVGSLVGVVVAVWVVPVWGQGVSAGAERVGAGEDGRAGDVAESEDETRADGEQAVEGLVRLGGEWDTNAGRVAPVDQAVSDGLLRYFLSMRGEVYDDGDTRVGIDVQQGGKAFSQRTSNDALLNSLRMSLSREIFEGVARSSGGESAGKRPTWRWVVDANLKDRIERESKQDYSRGSLRTGVQMRLGRVAVRGTGGWGFFAFRPNPEASSHGPQGTVSGTVWLGKRWRLQPSYTLAGRLFQATRYVIGENAQGESVPRRDESEQRRRDMLHVGRMSVGYRGDFLVRGTYELLVNRSNSYGQQLVRHGGIVDATVPLPWRLYASARLEVQRTEYEDPIFVARDFTVDENNRNAAILAVSRSFGDHWDLEARWRGFVEEFGAEADYRRQTVALGLGYGW